MECDLLRLHLSVLHLDLISTKHDGNILAHTSDISMPVGDVLVGDSAGHVEHDDGALAVDVVAIAEAAELLLARGVPAVEADGTAVGVKLEGVNRHADGGCGEGTKGTWGDAGDASVESVAAAAGVSF